MATARSTSRSPALTARPSPSTATRSSCRSSRAHRDGCRSLAMVEATSAATRSALLVEGRPIGEPLTIEVTEPDCLGAAFRGSDSRGPGLDPPSPLPVCGQFSNGATWADVDGDGVPDLFVTRLGKPAPALRQRQPRSLLGEPGDSGLAVRAPTGRPLPTTTTTATPISTSPGRAGTSLPQHRLRLFRGRLGCAVDRDGYHGTSTWWGDFDSDRYLDLYVSSYMSCRGEWDMSSLLSFRSITTPIRCITTTATGRSPTPPRSSRWIPEQSTTGSTGAGFAAAWSRTTAATGLISISGTTSSEEPGPQSALAQRRLGSGGSAFTDVSTSPARASS